MALTILVALHCEAKPIIDYFRMRKISSSPFAIFANPEKTIQLIQSGVGKIRMAAATTIAYCHPNLGENNKNSMTWLNVGIAGSSQHAIGDLILANKIIEHATQKAWYPFVSKFHHQSLLTTCDTSQTIYPEQSMIDMEASAFFQTANCFVTKEQIQVAKIISDNNIDTQQQINPKTVEGLVAARINIIANIANDLLMLSNQEQQLASFVHTEKFHAKWHFSYSQTLQLQEYLRRWQIIFKQEDAFAFCQYEKNARAVIQLILTKLDTYAYYLS